MARLNMVQPLYVCYDSSWKGKTCPMAVAASYFEHTGIQVRRKFIQKKASYTGSCYLKRRLQASRLLFQALSKRFCFRPGGILGRMIVDSVGGCPLSEADL